jgi:RHS repeat-associated protein
VNVGTAAGNGCGGTTLTATATTDRGLALITALTDIHEATSRVVYDGFGRIVEIHRPDLTTGQPTALPSSVIDYELPPDAHAAYSRVHAEEQDGKDPSQASYRESWVYVDGLGRVIATAHQADPTANDPKPWVLSGLITFDAKGAQENVYLATFADEPPDAIALAAAQTAAFTRQQHDAFGRPFIGWRFDKSNGLEQHYHALSVDAYDAADRAGGTHAGSYATSAEDGHGRTAAMVERLRVQGGALEEHWTTTQFLSTGEPQVITRTRGAPTGASAGVTRWIVYDTLGRMLVNVEPDTSVGFTTTPVSNPAGTKSWRYAYNDNDDLVGVNDARGCGANYAYDAGGRIVGEDYSPCTADHAIYTSGYEVTYSYDSLAADAASLSLNAGLSTKDVWTRGRLAAVVDRSGKLVNAFDARGRALWLAKRLASPAGVLAPRWYIQSNAYDAADRAVTEQTLVLDGGAGPLQVTSTVQTAFSTRNLVKTVGGDHGDLITGVTHDAEGLLLSISYADGAKTKTDLTYTPRRQLGTVQTYRGPPASWTSASLPTFQRLLQDADYFYDEVDNPIEIDDHRLPDEWPAGAQPVSRKMQYDDLYRLTRIDYLYAGGTDAWTSPFDAEDRGINPDPTRASASPRVKFASRVQAQTFAYDWLGNTVATSDDAGGFYDRSLGTITNGTATAGPYQLKSAASATTGASTGNLTAAYDAAGNMSGLAVTRSGICLPTDAICSQRFAYTWDEIGRLVRARRWDLAAPGAASSALPTTVPAADLRYTYDAADDRSMKAAYDASGNVRYTAYPLDPLELRGSSWDPASGDYERTIDTEVDYLFAHGERLGRLAKAKVDEPSLTSGAEHVFLEIADHLGSTSLVLDRDTGELVEAGTYQAYGAVESDYRPERWDSFREDYRFTGKEEDGEVGVTYFGARYYVPALGRWSSADPLNVHRRQSDMNVYAYVHGLVLKAIDSRGFDTTMPDQCDRPGGCELHYDHMREKIGMTLSIAAMLTGVGTLAIIGAYVSGGSSGVEKEIALQGAFTMAGAAVKKLPVPLVTEEVPLPKGGTVEPVNGTVNVGGGLENPNVTNLNPVVPNTGGPPAAAIPNLVQAAGEQIGSIFAPNSVKSLISARLPYATVNWEQLANGAARVMARGGKVFMNTWVQASDAEQGLARQRIADAFTKAGFGDVEVTGTGPGVMVRATAPGAVEPAQAGVGVAPAGSDSVTTVPVPPSTEEKKNTQ